MLNATRISSARGLHLSRPGHCIRSRAERFTHQFAKLGRVLDGQYCHSLGTDGRDRRLQFPLCFGFFADGKIDSEARAFSQLTFNVDEPIALFDDAVNSGQAQSCSLADLFSREKRLEDMAQSFFVHAAARVLDCEHDEATRGHPFFLVCRACSTAWS